MANQIEKLKKSIKRIFLEDFDINLMRTSGFIPVDKKDNNIYVIIKKERYVDMK